MGHCGILENWVLLMYTLEGISSVANLLLMKSLNKTETLIFLSVVRALFPNAIFLTSFFINQDMSSSFTELLVIDERLIDTPYLL